MNFNKLSPYLFFFLMSSAGVASADELNDYVRSLYSQSASYNTVQVAPNTQGQILQTQQLPNGSYGMLVNVTTGPNAGKKVWMPYNSSAPMMSLYSSQSALNANQSTDILSQAKMILSNTNLSGILSPGKERVSKESAEDIMGKVDSMNHKLSGFGKPGGDCDDCDLAKNYQRDTVAANEAGASRREPVMINALGITPSICRAQDSKMVFEACTYEGASSPSRFKITNKGPNSIVSGNKNRNRTYSLEAPGFATQDMMLKITDAVDERNSTLQESYMMFFPRTTLPSMTSEGSNRVVTLPTGESMTFDAQGKIVGGPLKENQPLIAGSTAKVSYQGTGITLRVDSVGTDPRMSSRSKSFAVVSKQGRNCEVPKKDLWPDQRESSALHFAFASDASFRTYLQKKCGFSF